MAYRSTSRPAAARPQSPPIVAGRGKPTLVRNSVQAKADSRPRHRPAQSYSAPAPNSISERIDKLLKEIEERHAEVQPIGLLTQSNRQAKPLPDSKPQRPSSLRQGGQLHMRKLSLDSVKPKSIIAKFAHRSEVGFMPGNPMKVNQDVYVEKEGLMPGTHFFSVCDGHGCYGHDVSGFLRVQLPVAVERELRGTKDSSEALKAGILKCDSDLEEGQVDIRFSGSTLNAILLQGTSLLCANVGDSRALLARELRPGHWMCVALSRDHKPDSPDEYDRILSSGGRVMAYQDEAGNPAGPARVWLRDQNTPGLAMSRSIGDAVARSVGVSCQPEIFEFSLQPEDKFLVLGSDGVFEFLSNEDVVKVVVPYWKTGDVQGACNALYEAAHMRWTQVSVT